MTFYVRTANGFAMPIFDMPATKSATSKKPTEPKPKQEQPTTPIKDQLPEKQPVQAQHFSGHVLQFRKAAPVRFQGWGQTGKALPEVNLKDFTSGDPVKRAKFVQALGQSLSDYGFVSISGHGVPPELIEQYYQIAPQVFALPMDTKKQYVRNDLGRSRGYYELGQEKKALVEGGPKNFADLKENWHSGAPDTENVFPKEGPADFKPKNLALFNAMEKTSLSLAGALGEYLDSIGLKDDGYLKSTLIADSKPIGNHLMRTIHYPPVGEKERAQYKAGESVIRAGQHCDMNLFTLLPEATEAGLEIMPRKNGKETGTWLPIHSQAGTLIMNVGDMLSLISGGKVNAHGKITEQGQIPSIRHRVVGNSDTLGKARYSIPFFTTPHYDKPLKNLKTHEEIPTVEFSFRRLNAHGSLTGTDLQAFRKNVASMVRPLPAKNA